MNAARFSIATLATLLAFNMMGIVRAEKAHVENTVASVTTTKAVPVTWANFVRAESGKMSKSYIDMNAFGS